MQEGLDVALQDNSGTFTVFAPDNAAFDNLATALGTDINGLLALPNLSDILLYHALGVTVNAADVTNGAIVTPLNTVNTIKMTKTSGGDVYTNQAKVNAADLTTDNGVVHVIDAVLVPTTLGIEEANETKLNVYPNPTLNTLKITNFDNNTYKVLNMLGESVLDDTTQDGMIDVSKLGNGNYVLFVTNETGEFKTKFVKL